MVELIIQECAKCSPKKERKHTNDNFQNQFYTELCKDPVFVNEEQFNNRHFQNYNYNYY